jgi:hypothetical protein
LWHVREVNPEELKFLLKVCARMAQPKENINYLSWYHHHEP